MPDQRFGNYGNDTPMQNGVEQWRRIPTRDEPKFDREPSWLEKQASSFTSDPNNAFGPPESLGLVTKNPANISKLSEMIQKIIPESGTPTQQAIAYMWAKYPKLMGTVKGMYSDVPDSFNGRHEWDGRIGLNTQSLNDLNRTNGWAQTNVSDAVKTLGHELTHGVQMHRRGLTPERYADELNKYGYDLSPSEIQAESGGRTAQKTLNDYVRKNRGSMFPWD